MGSIAHQIKTTIFIIIMITLIYFCPAWSAGYQEEKLFDGDFYSTEDLSRKIEAHSKEIKTLDNQIIALEKEIDWVVLKINRIQDSGRSASPQLKETILNHEKKIATLDKNRTRLQYLVKHYKELLSADREKTIEEIYRKKVPAPMPKAEEMKPQPQAQIKMQEIVPKEKTQVMPALAPSAAVDFDLYDGVSKAELQTSVDNAGLTDWVEIIGTGTCLRLETTLPILFATGSAKIADEYSSFFKKLADFLRPYDVKIFVNGYADVVPIKNDKYPSNFELGATRAANIVHQMVGYGLKPSIFSIESTGKYRFAAKGMSKQKSLERKAEIAVIFSG